MKILIKLIKNNNLVYPIEDKEVYIIRNKKNKKKNKEWINIIEYIDKLTGYHVKKIT